MISLKKGDKVWYKSFYGAVWECEVRHVPEDSSYEIEVFVTSLVDMGIITRPRRWLFTNELDARNCVRWGIV